MVYVEIDPESYHVLHPRPVYLIVSKDDRGRLNVMAASWVSPISDEPFLVAVPLWRKCKTFENISSNHEFTINVVDDKFVDTVWFAGTTSGREVDKWSKLGLKPVESKKISVPGIDGVLGFLECRVRDIHDYGENSLIIADVLAIHVDKEYYERYGWNLRKTTILLHVGGKAFATIGKLLFPSRSTR